MAILDALKGTVNTAVDTISTVTQTLVEKNRINAKLNRLRFIMKNESELMNRAYIALGKKYYEEKKGGSAKQSESEEKLFEVIESSKAKIAKARECYRQIVDSQNDIFYGKVTTGEQEPVKVSSDELVDITVACSNENEYDSSPFAINEEKSVAEEIKTDVEETADEVKEAVSEVAEKAEQVVENVAETVAELAEDSEASSEELF
ncbi:MAG: hypothetical protein J1E85_07960 [Ruminococcus sp.]|nr:hypothetical protein [Ruminococcus sp.]